uniref:Uncharacterized protein n=1 Tax=Varanus komodoensis TaxID=61221 RepID=A0A8D2LYW5_VARKO
TSASLLFCPKDLCHNKDISASLQACLLLPQSNSTARSGEESFANDCRVEFRGLKNGPSYREARQYRTSHHLVRFYFITRVYSAYVESILSDFKKGLESGLAPDVIVMSSCLWDLNALREYRENLEKLFARLDELLPSSCLIIWATAMPIRETTSGSCFRYKSTSQDVIEANFYSATLACCFGFDVLDLHYCLRLLEELHARDGVHWNYWAHRCISKLLLTHVAGAWGVELPKRTPQAGERGWRGRTFWPPRAGRVHGTLPGLVYLSVLGMQACVFP